MKDEARIQLLVSEWDEIHKRGQLGFWILLAIFEKPRYSGDIISFISQVSSGGLTLQEQSLYRALRRFKYMGLVEIAMKQSPTSGPERKYYSLTPTGRAVLREFTIRNIKPITSNRVIALLQAVEGENEDES